MPDQTPQKMSDRPVAVASDHAALALKREVVAHLERAGVRVLDLGTDSTASVDYPDFARKLVHAVLSGEAARGVLLCGTGIGVSIVANRYPGIRAALCHDHFTAIAARRHNDANVLCLGGRVLGTGVALEAVDTFLATPFEGGRHQRRLDIIDGPNDPRGPGRTP